MLCQFLLRGRDRERFNPNWLQCLLLSSALQGMSIHLRCSNPSHAKIRVVLSDEKYTRVRFGIRAILYSIINVLKLSFYQL